MQTQGEAAGSRGAELRRGAVDRLALLFLGATLAATLWPRLRDRNHPAFPASSGWRRAW